MTEVLRRVQDLLVGDIVAHNGSPRKVEKVGLDSFASRGEERDVIAVTFEDSREQFSPRLERMVKRHERFDSDVRLLLLESHYEAMKG